MLYLLFARSKFGLHITIRCLDVLSFPRRLCSSHLQKLPLTLCSVAYKTEQQNASKRQPTVKHCKIYPRLCLSHLRKKSHSLYVSPTKTKQQNACKWQPTVRVVRFLLSLLVSPSKISLTLCTCCLRKLNGKMPSSESGNNEKNKKYTTINKHWAPRHLILEDAVLTHQTNECTMKNNNNK